MHSIKKRVMYVMLLMAILVAAACGSVDNAASEGQYIGAVEYEAVVIEYDDVYVQSQTRQEMTLSDFRGRWQSYIEILGDMIFDVNDEIRSVLLSTPETGFEFFPINWRIDNDELLLSFNNEPFRITITLDKYEEQGIFTQFGQSTEISFTKLSDLPQHGAFAIVMGTRFYSRVAELNEYLYFADDGVTINFTYDLNRRDLYMDLIEGFGLDELTAGHYDIDLMLVLMDWIKDNFRHNGASGMPMDRDAMSIINYLRENPDGGNCRLLAILLAELLRLYGIEAKHITAYPPEENHPVHVVTHAFSRELNQWIMLDPTFGLYLRDDNGNFMNLYTLRRAFAEDTPFFANANAGHNRGHFSMREYKNFMADYLFRFSTGTDFTFGSEETGLDATQFMLVPVGFDGAGRGRITTSAEAFFAIPGQ